MDELKIKSELMKSVVGRAVTKYLKRKGIDLDIQINDIDGESTNDGTVLIRADVVVQATKAQVIKLIN